ncbi:hypothetical protein PIB30_093786 [Stylosanthes scabra]|uniref:PB1-like domain-containing protein n=1 Tax=Stylosanthes scabra TaxID=79078 RepID=A0ABU6YXZ8_9FABA|nr:hypothetical protein [Stylosanthes scabra]
MPSTVEFSGRCCHPVSSASHRVMEQADVDVNGADMDVTDEVGSAKVVDSVVEAALSRIAIVIGAMADVYVKPVFHVGGSYVKNDYGLLIYADGKVEKFAPMDIDFVNYGDLLKLLEEIGYKNVKNMKWYDFTEDDFERGLHTLKGGC